jgi:hypothetical protein
LTLIIIYVTINVKEDDNMRKQIQVFMAAISALVFGYAMGYTQTITIEGTQGCDGVYNFQSPTQPPPTPDPDPPPPPDPVDNYEVLTEGEILDRVSISSGDTKYYKFTVPSGSTGMQLSLSTWDWTSNQDMMLSKGFPVPTPDDYKKGESFKAFGQDINGSPKWARISPGSSNETLYIYPDLQPGDYYIMVHNTSSYSGSFGLHYSIW